MRRGKVSVSPFPLLSCPVTTSHSDNGGSEADVVEEAVGDLKDVAVLHDKIVGVEAVTLDENGPGALRVRPLFSPQEP